MKSLPLTPGVYLMKDSLGHIIYVGKAKQLKRRVSSYFQHSKAHPPKVKMMVRHIRDLEYRLTDTEFEAFMLECKLIKELKPLYNKKMKSPQNYTYILFYIHEGIRRMELAYNPDEREGCLAFGPFTSRHTVERAILGMKECMRILCNHPHGRHTPCLNYSLGLCLGMCADRGAMEQYNLIMEQIIGTLQGTTTGVLEEMERRMEEAAGRFDFEAAAKYRDYISAVQFLLQKARVITFAGDNRSIAILENMGSGMAKLIVIQANRILLAEKLRLEPDDDEPALHAAAVAVCSVLCTAAAQAYTGVTRHDIDEAQIIYSYLQSGSSSYCVIQEEWLRPGKENEIEVALRCCLAAGSKKEWEDEI